MDHQNLSHADKWQLNLQTTGEALMHMYNHKILTDVVLHLDSNSSSMSFSAHKLILASRSPKFFAMFFGREHRGSSNLVLIHDITHRAMDLLLWYIYSDKLEIQNEEELPEIAKAACIYEVDSLKQACKTMLSEYSVNVQNVCFLLDAANILEENRVRNKCLQTIKMDWKSVLQSPKFLCASEETVFDIVSEQNLVDTSKYEFIDGIIRWIQRKNIPNRELFSWIDMSSMTDKEFLGLINTYPSFFTKDEKSSILLNLSHPGVVEPPLWCNISTNMHYIEFEDPEISNYIATAPLKVKTNCNRSFRKCSFHGKDSFSATITFQLKLFEYFRDSMSLVMMELAFGSDYVPKENLHFELSCRKKSNFKKHKLKYWIMATNEHYYIITENKMELENNSSSLFSLRIHVRGLRKWGCCKPVSNGQYLVVNVPSDYSYNICFNQCEASFMELITSSDWLIFLDSTDGNKKFVITTFFFDSFMNHEKLLKKLHL